MKLSDESIGQIAKILQVAILTGTDIVDNLRLVEFENVDNELFLTEDYRQRFDDNLSVMLQNARTSEEPSDE